MNYWLVFVGGGLGSIARFLFFKWFPVMPTGFPTGTFVANFLSSLILGFLLGYHFNKQIVNDGTRLLIATGFCGGFSTFSTFSYETFMLANTGNLKIAALNLLVNMVLCYLAIMLGFMLTKALA